MWFIGGQDNESIVRAKLKSDEKLIVRASETSVNYGSNERSIVRRLLNLDMRYHRSLFWLRTGVVEKLNYGREADELAFFVEVV